MNYYEGRMAAWRAVALLALVADAALLALLLRAVGAP